MFTICIQTKLTIFSVNLWRNITFIGIHILNVFIFFGLTDGGTAGVVVADENRCEANCSVEPLK